MKQYVDPVQVQHYTLLLGAYSDKDIEQALRQVDQWLIARHMEGLHRFLSCAYCEDKGATMAYIDASGTLKYLYCTTIELSAKVENCDTDLPHQIMGFVQDHLLENLRKALLFVDKQCYILKD